MVVVDTAADRVGANTMNQTNTVMLGILVALGVILVAGLIAIPVIEQQAAHADKGGVPNTHASSKARGRGHL
jgi:hypothetical protein